MTFVFLGLKAKGYFNNSFFKDKIVEIENNENINNAINATPLAATMSGLGSQILASDKYIEANLTRMTLTLYDKNLPIKTYDIFYKAPEDKWFRSPTGYFQVLTKERNHFSSLFPVYMPYSLRFYEDFFIHGIPYYPNGEQVPPRFTGGCLRLKDEDAKEVYEFASVGMPVIIFDEVRSFSSENWQLPLDPKGTWVRQNFNNPVKINGKYFQHTGVDLVNLKNRKVMAAAAGRVVYIETLSSSDHGFGNAVILEHNIGGEKIYSLYGHLNTINPEIKIGKELEKGEAIGEMGASGYGCSLYWRIGPDGCDAKTVVDYHLHFEIKKAPVLYNPEGGFVCGRGKNSPCYGYSPKYPTDFGYFDPLLYLSSH